MIHSIGSMKNLPANINLNSIPDYFKNRTFTTSVGFRCYYPSLANNYPVEKNGLLFIEKINNLLKMYYFTKDVTFVSSGIYIGNAIRKIDWFQIVDGRHSSIFNTNIDSKKLVTDNDIKSVVDRFISKYDDTELWKSIEPKFHKELFNQYTNKRDPHLKRSDLVLINTNFGLVVRGNNIHTSRHGIHVRRPESGASISVYSDGAHHIIGNHVNGNTHIVSDRKLLIQSRDRPIAQNADAGGGNRDIVIRADVRWKQMYNGRQGLRSISYPEHAREVIVQLYTDVGGRVHRTQYPHAGFRWGKIPYGRTEGALWDDIHPPQYGIGGEAVNGIIGRDRAYREFAPMHFVRGIYNRINQDTAFVEHHGNCTITINSIGYDNVVNGRSYTAVPHNFNPFDQNLAIVDERYGFATNRTRIIMSPSDAERMKRMRGYIIKDLALSSERRFNYWPMNIISQSVWIASRNLGSADGDIPFIRRVWWR